MKVTCIAKCTEFKISLIEGVSEKTGKPYSFYSLERSYKNAQGQWESERIALNSRDLAVVGMLVECACRADVKEQARAANQRASEAAR